MPWHFFLASFFPHFRPHKVDDLHGCGVRAGFGTNVYGWQRGCTCLSLDKHDNADNMFHTELSDNPFTCIKRKKWKQIQEKAKRVKLLFRLWLLCHVSVVITVCDCQCDYFSCVWCVSSCSVSSGVESHSMHIITAQLQKRTHKQKKTSRRTGKVESHSRTPDAFRIHSEHVRIRCC